MTKTSRRTGPHRPTLGQIARILPEAGSREARLLIHVLKCDICTDAALSILEIGNRRPKGKTPNYDSAFAAAATKASWLFERRIRAVAFAEELLKITGPEARRRRTLELARVEPWSVTVSLLDAATLLLETDPHRAGELAKLAAAAAEEMSPEDHPADRVGLFAEAHRLLGESLYRLQEQVEEEVDQAERQFAELSGIERYPFSTRSIRRRRSLERREGFDA